MALALKWSLNTGSVPCSDVYLLCNLEQLIVPFSSPFLVSKLGGRALHILSKVIWILWTKAVTVKYYNHTLHIRVWSGNRYNNLHEAFLGEKNMAGFEKPVFHTTALSVSQNTNFHLRAMFGTLYPEVIKNYQLQRESSAFFFFLESLEKDSL